ncbi:MAG: hypothetical protein R3B47_17515 [Bacteroidia bacterium]
MKLTIEIKDHKLDFFLELLASFEDFITVHASDPGMVMEKEAMFSDIAEAEKDISESRVVSNEELKNQADEWLK